MISVIQRVTKASVNIDGSVFSAIESGLLVLAGLQTDDTFEDIKIMSRKILSIRLFDDENGALNKNVCDISGELLLVPNFTLAADTSRGNRPGFSTALPPDSAKPLFEKFVSEVHSSYPKVCSGLFGADMKVKLVNDGPITISLASKK